VTADPAAEGAGVAGAGEPEGVQRTPEEDSRTKPLLGLRELIAGVGKGEEEGRKGRRKGKGLTRPD